MSQCDNTEGLRPLARRGSDGLAQLGPTRFDIMGIRLVEGEEGAGSDADADDSDDTEQDSDQDAQGADDDKDEDEGFDGDFDAKRARRTIDRLRRERNTARDAAKNAKNDPEMTKLQAENMRLRVAMKVGLDDDLADRLKGTTEDELLEDAQKLLDRFYPADDKKLSIRQPKPNLKGGSKPDEEPDLSADDIVNKALGK